MGRPSRSLTGGLLCPAEVTRPSARSLFSQPGRRVWSFLPLEGYPFDGGEVTVLFDEVFYCDNVGHIFPSWNCTMNVYACQWRRFYPFRERPKIIPKPIRMRMMGQYRFQLKFQPLPTSKLNIKATMNRPIRAGIMTLISNRLFVAR